MLFSSPIFLFLFLPVVLAVYAVLPRRFWNGWLLLASLFFYAWGERLFVAVMLASIVLNYILGLVVERFRDADPRARWWIMAGAIFPNLALLIAYKYANFLADSLSSLLSPLGVAPFHLPPVHLPIGISFFTFHALSYLVDVYRRDARAQRDPVKLALYITLFPQLIAGPILRFHQIAGQIDERVMSLTAFSDGVRRFIIGLGKKVLIANPLALPADKLFALAPDQLSSGAAWLAVACYTLQIYFDFSGYSDMAIGLGKMFGFHFPENFNYPYISQSVKEFWRRWHISLSTWFRDYLYVPLGGNRVSAARTYFNLLTVFFLCGLWHGASWTFVLWGLYHGAFLIFERLFAFRRLELPWLSPLRHLYTLLVVMIGWVFFRAGSLAQALGMLHAMSGLHRTTPILERAPMYWSNEVCCALVVGVLASTPLFTHWTRAWSERLRGSPAARGSFEVSQLSGLAAIFLLAVMQLAAGTYNPFIYFRF